MPFALPLSALGTMGSPSLPLLSGRQKVVPSRSSGPRRHWQLGRTCRIPRGDPDVAAAARAMSNM
eukprot:6455435-Pyramimonas_sp.AAC.1